MEENTISQESNKPRPRRASSFYGVHRIPLQAFTPLPNPSGSCEMLCTSYEPLGPLIAHCHPWESW